MPTRPAPSQLTPDQRRREIAQILARGLIRHIRIARSMPPPPPEKSSPPRKTGLAFLDESRPCVSDRPAG